MSDNLTEKLIRAVKIGYLEGVQRLLVEGSDPNAKGQDGVSALGWANIISDTDIKKILEAVGKSYEKEKEARDKRAQALANYRRNNH